MEKIERYKTVTVTVPLVLGSLGNDNSSLYFVVILVLTCQWSSLRPLSPFQIFVLGTKLNIDISSDKTWTLYDFIT